MIVPSPHSDAGSARPLSEPAGGTLVRRALWGLGTIFGAPALTRLLSNVYFRKVSTEPLAPDTRPGPPRDLGADPLAMRALAHPVRIRLLEELTFRGPLTATQAAAHVGESPSSCSFHLRTLAKYGFVEEAGGGTGRQRPWRVVSLGNRWRTGPDTEATIRTAGDALAAQVRRRDQELFDDYQAHQDELPAEWTEAVIHANFGGWLTADELAEIGARLIDELAALPRPAARPVGAAARGAAGAHVRARLPPRGAGRRRRPRWTPVRDLLRHRDFRLLFAGQSLSMFGDMAMLIVLAMWAKELTGSNGVAGSVFAALVLPSLLAPLGGVLIDRFRRRTVMIVTDLATAAVVLLLLLVDGRDDLWLLYVVAFLYGASLVAFDSARSALLSTMLEDHQLGQANGALSTVRESLRLVAPLAGAGLYAGFGGPAVAVVDAATFLVSAAALIALRVDEPAPVRSDLHFLAEASAGGRHLLGNPVLRATVVATVICMLAIGISESVFFAVVDQGLGKPVEFVGVLGAIQGVGAILAGITITALIRRTGELRPFPGPSP